MKDYKGTVIYEDKTRFATALSAWEGKLLPAITKLRHAFERMGIGKFNQMIFDELLAEGIKGIAQRYVERVNKAVSEVGNKLFASIIDTEEKTGEKVEAVKECLSHLQDRLWECSSLRQRIHLEDCVIENSKPTLRKDQLLRRYQTVIDSDLKNEVYNRVVKLQEDLNAFRRFLDSHTPSKFPITDGADEREYFLSEDSDGYFQVNNEFFSALDTL